MEKDFIVYQLKSIAIATQEINNAISVLIGYLKQDDHDIIVEGGPPQLQYHIPQDNDTEYLDLTDKEISKMPKQFRKEFRTNGLRAHVRKRTRGNSTSFEIRCRKGGLNISATGATLEEAKLRFIQKLNDYQNYKGIVAPNIPSTFNDFAMYYFENFRKRKVKSSTYKKDLLRLKKHLLPYFGVMKLKDIPPQMCQELIDKFVAAGNGKTAEELFTLLNCTFKTAVKHGILQHNPIDLVIHLKHERQHGKALTTEEEKLLLSEADEPFKTIFAIALYTGLRPNEYKTAQITKTMIIARNSKRHNGKEETKRIPITPMLRPYIDDNTVMPRHSLDTLRRILKRILGERHKLYDLRTTFYTRCQMCNIAPAARDEFVGHSSGVLSNTYTDLPDEYLIKEGQKLNY